jgi:cellulose synthase/poly-beta-1,6-N-acetylglucosamine synthase-like glycosyltransferase/peptidoglycan/xylan/chitin deacetylase (PgdA/CDA1 family)
MTHRATIAFCVGCLVVLLLVQGFSTKTIGASGTVDAVSAASPLAHALPILGPGPKGLVSHQPPMGRRVALTFDDGPDPRWTPCIAAILRRLHAPATFFEVGGQIVRHADVTRMLWRDGFELGDHTFTHANLVGMPSWERNAQVGLTESALAGAIGRRTRLVRPPYSATTDAVTPEQDAAWNELAQRGYRIVLSNYDTGDWSQPGVGSIVRAALPPRGHGGIVLMHDGGGRRAETVAALPRIVQALRARGAILTTVSGLEGQAPLASMLPVTGWQHSRGWMLVTTLWLARFVTGLLTRIVELITILVGLRMLAVLALATIDRRRSRERAGAPPFTPALSILVPAHDEAVGIERGVRSLAASRYPAPFEIIVIDDGSRDDTAAIVERLGLENVRVLRQAAMGKFAALNRGLANARHPIIVTVDADTVFEPVTLYELVQRFREPDVGAISGNTKVGNRRGLLGRWQHLEYVMGFNLDRRAYEVLGCMPTVPGAIGAYRMEALRDVGGVSGATLAEDTDLTMSLSGAGWRVVHAERARAWTEAPETLRGLWRQRCRWAYGTIQSLYKHRGAALRRGRQPIGRRALPYMAVFQVALPLCAPLIDLFAIYSILFLDPMPILAFWLAFNVVQLVLCATALRFDGESLRPLWTLPLQQVVYRQLMYLVVIDSVLTALAGNRRRWNRIARTGDAVVGATADR